MTYRINYAKVISQAGSIEKGALELAAQVRALEQLEQDCNAIWKGQAADVFIRKLHTLSSEMLRTQKQMTDLASTIKYCADRVQSADRQAEKSCCAEVRTINVEATAGQSGTQARFGFLRKQSAKITLVHGSLDHRLPY